MKEKYAVKTKDIEYCPKCGAKLIRRGNIKVCPVCGTAYLEEEVEDVKKEDRKVDRTDK